MHFLWIIYWCNDSKYITFSNQIGNTIIILVNHNHFIIALFICDISKWGQWCQFLVSPRFHKFVSLALTVIQGLYIINTCKKKSRVLSFLIACIFVIFLLLMECKPLVLGIAAQLYGIDLSTYPIAIFQKNLFKIKS